MIDWNDCTPLTRKEFDAFINTAIPFLKNMEAKNIWDFIINDMSIGDFCKNFILYAFEHNSYKNYQKYNTKVKDMLTIYHILIEADWTVENETFRNNKDSEIWKLVLNKINTIADNIF